LAATLVPPPRAVKEPAAARLAERRVCSVLFCDLVGFTPMSESRDPEEVRELLSEYFDVARTVIGRYGVVVEKFIGDAVMAVWGAPSAAEGDSERAVRAALDVVAAVAQLGVERGIPGMAARAGVVTGEVAVTLGATQEGMVAGDAVNTAARVQAAAPAGAVLVDTATSRLASSAIGFVDSGEHSLKGKTEPERLWRATRVLSGVGGSQRVDGLEAPLTGRDAELRLIKELFHAATERRQPRLVLVSGPAGVGKSRLGWEFEKYVDGLKDLVAWHRGRCLSYGDGVSFWALGEIVRQRFGIAEEDSPQVASAKLADRLPEFVPDPVEQAYVGARLSRLLGVAFAGGVDQPLAREELFAGWRLFFERLSDADPVLLLVEDAHYADTGLLDFLEHLIDWSRDLPIFVVLFARPELEQTRPRFGVGRNRTALTLDPLVDASMDALLESLVPGMPDAARVAITRHSQGIPLFAVETVRSLIDRDVVQPIDGVYRLVGDVGELAVPDSLHTLLAARLDALDPQVRQLVTDAAVLGSTFPAEALVAISGHDEATVRDGLAELLRREVFAVSADRLSPERGSYRFAQEMLRQVAYDTLSRHDRKARHLAVAAHLRSAFPDDGEEVMDVVAKHYLDALAAVPDDADTEEITDHAVAALTRGARRAERTGSPGRAAGSYATAAALIEESTRPNCGLAAAAMWHQAARAAMLGDETNAAIDHAARAQRLYSEHSELRAAARTKVTIGEGLRRIGRHREAREELMAAIDVLNVDPDTDTVAAMHELAGVETFSGGKDADRLTSEALAMGQALGVEGSDLIRLVMIRGIWLTVHGRRVEAAAYYREAARLAERYDDSLRWGHALLNLSDVLGTSGDPQSAADAARTAVTRLRQSGNRGAMATARLNLVIALLETGDWDAAAAVLVEGVEGAGLGDIDAFKLVQALVSILRGERDSAEAFLSGLGEIRLSEDPQDRANVAAVTAHVELAGGRPEEALTHAQVVLGFAEAMGIGSDMMRWVWPLATRVALDLGDTGTVEALVAQLDAFPMGQLAPMQQAERDLVHARLAASRNDPDAKATFSDAVAGLRSKSTPYHLAHGLLDHAEYLTGIGDHEGAAAAVSEARVIADRLRCPPLLERADREAVVLATD
jgi:class 3 adenylate cyclase/tetratricopeptide (TPR) repeat protein